MRSLKNFAPALKVQLDQKIEAAMLPIRDKARGFAPVGRVGGLYNWQKSYRESKSGPQTPAAANAYRKFPLYDTQEVTEHIVYKKGSFKKNNFGFSAFSYVANTSAAGAIYETSGRKSGASGQIWSGPGGSKNTSRSRNRNAGAQFINNMGGLYGTGNRRGRLIYRAWNEDQGKAQDAVLRAIQNTADDFNKNYLVVGNYALMAA
jgi:hypothetical protein